MFTSHLLCICLECGRSPLTMETIISAITHPITVKWLHTLYIYIYLYTRMYIMENFTFMENQIYTDSKYASVAGKPNHCFWFSLYKGYGFSSLRHCTLSYRPTGLLVVQTSEASNCVKHIKKEVVNRELFFSVWMNMVLLLIIYLFFAV